jgi:hypothetical protein
MAGFQLLPSRLEESQFQQVPEGWLFTTANPWFFGSRRTYLLTEAQKPAIAQRVRRGLHIRLLLLIPIMLILIAADFAYPALRDFHSVATWLGFLAFGVLLAAVFNISDYLNMRPLLRDIPRSSQKIPLRNMMRAQGQALSIKALAIFTLIFVFGFLASSYNALAAITRSRFSTAIRFRHSARSSWHCSRLPLAGC